MIITILTFAIILLILVVIHEAGHFFAAKLMGIKVEEFGFGLPPRAWGK
ncbi:MAG: Site-2 protease, Metallo peptidase, MEROPS family M50B, partial [Candidatus Roizmanbacteria bacterium GW2011_GWC2_41_7]